MRTMSFNWSLPCRMPAGGALFRAVGEPVEPFRARPLSAARGPETVAADRVDDIEDPWICRWGRRRRRAPAGEEPRRTPARVRDLARDQHEPDELFRVV